METGIRITQAHNDKPRPVTTELLAKRMNVTPRTAQRYLKTVRDELNLRKFQPVTETHFRLVWKWNPYDS